MKYGLFDITINDQNYLEASQLDGESALYLNAIHVDKKLRGHGIGTNMITHLESHAINNGYTQIFGLFEPYDNVCPQSVSSFYRSNGYRLEYRVVHGVERECVVKDLEAEA